MIRSIEYLRTKYETGDVPTQEDFYDLLDSCYGNGGNNIYIPKLTLFTKNYYQSNISMSNRSATQLIGRWSSNNKEFLKYNPEIWLFRYKNRNKIIDETNEMYINHKKYVHTPHLNGTKYPHSNYYGGKIDSVVPELKNNGVNTEWEFSNISGSTLNNNSFIIPINIYDWFYVQTQNGYELLNDTTVIGGTTKLKVLGRKKTISFPFKLAIVIDDPMGGNQKIIGNLSDRLYLRYIPNQDRFIYERSEINMSKIRYNF